MLEAKSICASYNGREVLRNVSFSLAEGMVLAVLGPNGAGKTSLLKTINGTLPTASGQILINRIPISQLSRREIAAKIAVVAQENETKFPITVLEFVLAGRFIHGGIFGWETERDRSISLSALDECDLQPLKDRLMSELSGGERQRAVFARAVASEASLLMLDEPTANLDLAHQGSLFRMVRRKCQEENYSAVVITHDLNVAAEFADVAILLKSGGVFGFGPPETILTTENIRTVYDVNVLLDRNPGSGNVRITNLY